MGEPRGETASFFFVLSYSSHRFEGCKAGGAWCGRPGGPPRSTAGPGTSEGRVHVCCPLSARSGSLLMPPALLPLSRATCHSPRQPGSGPRLRATQHLPRRAGWGTICFPCLELLGQVGTGSHADHHKTTGHRREVEAVLGGEGRSVWGMGISCECRQNLREGQSSLGGGWEGHGRRAGA